MCKAPKPPAPKDPKKPQYLRNRYLDAEYGGAGAIKQMRTGRSAFRIDLGTGVKPIGQPDPAATTPQPVHVAPPPAVSGIDTRRIKKGLAAL